MGEGADPRKARRFERRVLHPAVHRRGGRQRPDDPGLPVRRVRDDDRGRRRPRLRDRQRVAVQRALRPRRGPDDLPRRRPPGVPIRLVKNVAYHTSRGVPVRELVDRCRRTLDRALVDGVDHQVTRQRAWLDGFWERSDVEVEGQPEVQQAVRWNLFQLAQAVGRAEGAGVPAKGVTGSGYSGHYFWDTEIYTLPFLTYTTPQCTRNALRFRYGLLPAARVRAEQMAQRGALFPWRTINGEEASAYYAAGTAQYHIDADISYALSQYVAATGDLDFLEREAVDILVETARMWADLGFWRVNGDGGLPHPRGHRSRRVHHRRQRQPLHQRDGAVQPARRRRDGALAERAQPRRLLPDGRPARPGGRRGRGVAARRRADVRPLRGAPRHPPAGRPVPRPGGVGPRPPPRRRSGRCCCTTTRW